jgi:hypothetical protein
MGDPVESEPGVILGGLECVLSDDADERFDCHSRVVGRRRCVVDDRLRTFGATSPTAASSVCMGTLTGAGLRPHSRFNSASVKSAPFLNSAFMFLLNSDLWHPYYFTSCIY